jgi:hypothetical protein
MPLVVNPRGLGGQGYASEPNWPYGVFGGVGRGSIARTLTAENDYLIDRGKQRSVSLSGIDDFVSQDLMVTESMAAWRAR